MKIRILSSKDEIETIGNEEIVHFAFRPSNVDILSLIKSCPKLKAIHVPNSYKKTNNFIYLANIFYLSGKGKVNEFSI